MLPASTDYNRAKGDLFADSVNDTKSASLALNRRSGIAAGRLSEVPGQLDFKVIIIPDLTEGVFLVHIGKESHFQAKNPVLTQAP